MIEMVGSDLDRLEAGFVEAVAGNSFEVVVQDIVVAGLQLDQGKVHSQPVAVQVGIGYLHIAALVAGFVEVVAGSSFGAEAQHIAAGPVLLVLGSAY